jgi:hypothetical protein
MIRRTLGAFAVGESLPEPWRLFFGGLSTILALLGIWNLWGWGADGRRALALLLALGGAPVLLTWLNALARPIFDERYLIAAAPAFYLLLAAGITMSRNRLRAWSSLSLGIVLTLGLVLSLNNYYTDPVYSKTRGWRELAAAFKRFSTGLPGEDVRLVQNFPDPTIWYYYHGSVEHLVLPPQPNDAAGATTTVDALVEEEVKRVILPVQPAAWWDGSGIAPAALVEAFTLVAEIPVGVWPVQIYTRPPAALEPVGVTFANGPTLAAAAVTPDQLVPGGLLTVHLAWESEGATLTGSKSLFLHLLDGDGQIVAQIDRPLPLSSISDQPLGYGILLPDMLPAGSYRLLAGIYEPDQVGAPRLVTGDGRDAVELATWTPLQ